MNFFNGKMMFSENLGLCASLWKNPSRTHVYKGGLLKVREGNTKGAWWGAGGVHQQREHAFSGVFKTYTNPWGGQTQEIPICGKKPMST
jgi:hypothetical protein